MSDSGITREEAEAMGLIDHDEEARRHAAAVEELTRLRNEHEASSPASPSGNRHDGVRVWAYRDPNIVELQWFHAPLQLLPCEPHVAHPVAIDAARTAVIEAARAYREALRSLRGEKLTNELTLLVHDAKIALFASSDRLDALTTKGATT